MWDNYSLYVIGLKRLLFKYVFVRACVRACVYASVRACVRACACSMSMWVRLMRFILDMYVFSMGKALFFKIFLNIVIRQQNHSTHYDIVVIYEWCL